MIVNHKAGASLKDDIIMAFLSPSFFLLQDQDKDFLCVCDYKTMFFAYNFTNKYYYHLANRVIRYMMECSTVCCVV